MSNFIVYHAAGYSSSQGLAHYVFLSLPNHCCFLIQVIHPSFIWIQQRFTDRLCHTDTTHKKTKGGDSENVPLCKAQNQLEFILEKNCREKRLHQPTSVSAPVTLSASARHFSGHSWILLVYLKVKDTHRS